ncbi:MAG: TVP38/TMEM64 family protein [Pirellulaceae bacterium]
MPEPTESAAQHPSAAPFRWRVVLLVLGCVIVGVFALLFRDQLSLAQLARHETALREWGREHPVALPVVAFLAYVAITAVVPSALALTLAYGWFFGFWRGVLVVSFASTTGAVLTFLFSRFVFRDAVQARFAERWRRTTEAVDRDGVWYLLALRLTPVVPFFVVNALMGLTTMRARTFWLVSQLGMLPGTMVYAYAGSAAPSLRELAERGWQGVPVTQLSVAFALLGCFPLVARWAVRRWRQRDASP